MNSFAATTVNQGWYLLASNPPATVTDQLLGFDVMMGVKAVNDNAISDIASVINKQD